MKLPPEMKLHLVVRNRPVLLQQISKFCDNDQRILDLSTAICNQIHELLKGYKSSEATLALQLIADATIASMMDDDLIRDAFEEV